MYKKIKINTNSESKVGLHINELPSDELICIFRFLSFKKQVYLIPRVCKKWHNVVNMIPSIKNATLLGNDIFYKIIKKQGIVPYWMQFQEKVLFENKYFQKYNDLKLAVKVCHQLLQWKFDKFITLIYYDIENNIINDIKMQYVSIFRNMSKIIIGESYLFSDMSVFNSLKKLRYLEIISCPKIKTVSTLKSNLQHLYLKNCQGVTDISSLIYNCPKISYLGINDCHYFTDISYFYKFPNLEILSLDRCKNITNLKFLNKCRKLKKLYLYKCQSTENVHELSDNLYWIEIMNYPADLDY